MILKKTLGILAEQFPNIFTRQNCLSFGHVSAGEQQDESKTQKKTRQKPGRHWRVTYHTKG